MLSARRETFTDSECILPELAMLVRHSLSRARVPGITAHLHPDVFEIFYLERGEVEWWTGSETHRVGAGQIYINRPGERHGSLGHALQPCAYWWLQLRALDRPFLPFLPRAEAQLLFRALSEAEPRCFAGAPQILACFGVLLEEARHPSPLSATILRATLHLLLAQLARDQMQSRGETRSETREKSPPIRRALLLVQNGLETELSPALLAREAGLSLGHFRERFLAETGFTPHAFILRARIEATKPLLSKRESTVSDIARRFGFCSSQHFATAFKKLEGTSPSDFAKNA